MKSRLVVACMALCLGALAAAPAAVAQQNRDENGRPIAVEGAGRAAQGRQRRDRRVAAPSPEQVLAAAQEQATLANTGCQVTEAKLLGTTGEQTSVYEVACSTGPGYMIESKTPPSAVDCVVLAHSAETLRATNPEADVGPQCVLASNTDTRKFLMEYAQQAQVPCSVDEVKVMGRANSGAVIYEAGCADAAGYWISKAADGAWSRTPCIQVIAERGACALTTSAEIAAFVKPFLANTDASACDVTAARLMGQNANGMFYEAKCAVGDGFIARVKDGTTQQVYPCATAQQIGGGCTLTTAAPVAPAASTEQ